MNNNLYAGRTYPDAPLMFDKIYSNYQEALEDVKKGAVFIGRYVIIKYCDVTLSSTRRLQLQKGLYDAVSSEPEWLHNAETSFVENYLIDTDTSITNDIRKCYDRIVYRVGHNGSEYELIETTNLHTLNTVAEIPFTLQHNYDIENSEQYRNMSDEVASVAFVQNVADGTIRTVGDMVFDLLGADYNNNITPTPPRETELPFKFYTVQARSHSYEIDIQIAKPTQLKKLVLDIECVTDELDTSKICIIINDNYQLWSFPISDKAYICRHIELILLNHSYIYSTDPSRSQMTSGITPADVFNENIEKISIVLSSDMYPDMEYMFESGRVRVEEYYN